MGLCKAVTSYWTHSASAGASANPACAVAPEFADASSGASPAAAAAATAQCCAGAQGRLRTGRPVIRDHSWEESEAPLPSPFFFDLSLPLPSLTSFPLPPAAGCCLPPPLDGDR